ncbi:KxYKxGKxW signal peptide domain-containing protein, partial [Weissella fabalis]
MSKKNNYYKLMHETKYEHFKMYKAGKQWFVAGMSLFGGVLGASAVGTQVAHADISNGNSDTAKEVDQGAVLATQQTATIPAASTSTSAVNTSTSQSTSTSESLSKSISESISTSTSATNASTSKSALANSTSNASTSISETSTSTSDASTTSTSTSEASTSTSTTSTSTSEASTSTSTTSTSTSDASTSSSKAATSTKGSASTSNSLTNSTTVDEVAANKTATASAQKALALALPKNATVTVDATTHELSIVLANDQTPSTAILNAAQAYAEANGLVVNFNHRTVADTTTTKPTNFGDYKSSVLTYLNQNKLATQAQINSAQFQSVLANSYKSFLAQPKQHDAVAASGIPGPMQTPSDPAIWFLVYLTGGFTTSPKQVTNTIVNTSTTVKASFSRSAFEFILGQSHYTWYMYNPTTKKWDIAPNDNKATQPSILNLNPIGDLVYTPTQTGTYYFQLKNNVSGLIYNLNYYSQVIQVNVFDKSQNATKITTNVDQSYLYYNGQQTQANANVGNGTGDVKWTSDNESLAKIDSVTGVITANNAKQSGVVTFTATITNPDGKTLSSKVQVKVGGGLDNQTVTAGSTATFPIQGTVAPKNATIVYQWYQVGAGSFGSNKLLTDQTGSTLVLNNVAQTANGTQYYAIIKVTPIDSKGKAGDTSSFQTNTATLTVVSNTPTNSTSISNSTSQSTSSSTSIPTSTSKVVSDSDSMSTSDSTSQSDSTLAPSRSASASLSDSESTSTSEVKSTSISTSVSDSESTSTVDSASTSASEVKSTSLSTSVSDSESTSTVDSDSASTSTSEVKSTSMSTSVSDSESTSTVDSDSASTSTSEVKSTSLSTSVSDSESTSASEVKSTSLSTSVSDSDSASTSASEVKSTSLSTSVSDSESTSTVDSDSASTSTSEVKSTSMSTSVSDSESTSTVDS